MFHIGQLVVCINTEKFGCGAQTFPVKGRVYTVRELFTYNGEPHVHLNEIVNPPDDFPAGYGEPWFNAKRFRPVDDKRIEVFRRIATSPKERIHIGEDA